MRLATWNVEWAEPATSRGNRVRAVIDSLGASVIVLTEGCRDLLPAGHSIDGGDDWGYPLVDARRRKVLIWSKYPMTPITVEVASQCPQGRLAIARVDEPAMSITVVAVCIPWRDAHVRSGRRDRARWEDHLSFITCLHEVIGALEPPYIIAGDFNQRIPTKNQPKHVSAALSLALSGLDVPTAGEMERPLIDHIALSTDLVCSGLQIVSDSDSRGRLTDHQGAVAEISPASLSRRTRSSDDSE